MRRALARAVGLLLIVATFVVFGREARAASPDAGAEAGAPKLTDAEWCEARLELAFRMYLPHEAGDTWDDPEPSRKADFVGVKDRLTRDARVLVVVATVPDPIDTGYVYQFNQTERAIQLGVEQYGYLRDEVWLPWRDERAATVAGRGRSEGCRTHVPGVQIFRHDQTKRAKDAKNAEDSIPETVVVLFVGETPAEGVHKTALERAFGLATDLDWKRNDGLRILGPSYSGSAHSIDKVIGDRRAVIVSGTATKRGIGDVLGPGWRTPPRPRDFRITTIDDALTEQLFFAWLKERDALRLDGARLARVGLLVESGTLFGTRENNKGLQPEVILQFPRGVAELQRAHEAQAAKQQAQAKSPVPTTPDVLDPAFDERSTPRPTAVDPSPKTVAALELELRNLLTEVSREGLRYLCIRATDSGDAVFLAQQVRAVAPDVRLVFLSSDVLLLHPAFGKELRGSLIVTPYPFFGTSDLSNADPGSPAAHTHLPWESQLAEGVYNAAVATLGRALGAAPSDILDKLGEYRPLALKTTARQRGCSPDDPLLPLWIATIGNEAVFPLEVVAPKDACRAAFYDPCADGAVGGSELEDPVCNDPRRDVDVKWTLQVDEDITPPRGWQFLLFAVVLLALVESVLFWGGFRLWGGAKTAEGGPFALLTKKYVGRSDLVASRAKLIRYSGVRGAVIAAVAVYMVVVHFLALHAEPRQDQVQRSVFTDAFGWFVVVAAATVALSAALRMILAVGVDIQAFVDIRRWGSRVSHAVHAAALYVLVGFFAVLAAMRANEDLPVFFDSSGRASSRGVAFILRSLPLSSGVSAAIVVVALGAALAIWLTNRLNRAALSHGINLITPGAKNAAAPDPFVVTPIAYVIGDGRWGQASSEKKANDEETPCDDIRKQEERLQNVLQRPAMYGASLLVSLLIMLVPIVSFFIKKPTTLECRGDTVTLIWLLCLVTFAVALTTQHLLEFWIAFRRLLDRLRVWKHSSWFSHAKPHVGASVSKLVTGRHLEANELLLCAELAERLVDLGATTELESVRKEAKLLRALRAEEKRSEERRGRDLGQALLQLAHKLVSATTSEHASMIPNSGAYEATAARPDPKETFVACVLGVLLNRYVRHFRAFMTATTMSSVLLTFVIAIYPFEPHHLMMTTAWILALFVVGAGVIVFFGMERSPVLSALSGTGPSEIKYSREVLVRFLTWVVLPLVSIFAAQYPAFGNLVGQLFEPFAGAFR